MLENERRDGWAIGVRVSSSSRFDTEAINLIDAGIIGGEKGIPDTGLVLHWPAF
jgi:hypothetical protein